MTPTITREMVEQMETLLKHGSRVEVLIEQGKVAIVEVRRKLKMKEAGTEVQGKSNGTVSE